MLTALLALILAVNHYGGTTGTTALREASQSSALGSPEGMDARAREGHARQQETMSAIITLPPVLIDPAYYSRMTFTEQGGAQGRIMASGGPWFVGSSQYMFLEGGGVSSGITPLQVFKSINNGVTWTAMDAASANAPPNPTNDPGQNASIFDATSGKIFVAYQGDGSTNRFSVYTFNTATDLWEVPSAQSVVDNKGETFVMARLSTGDVYVFYSLYGFSGNTVYEKLSGGVWSTATIDASANGRGTYSVIVDPSDRMHLAYNLQAGAGTIELKYVQVSAAGAIGVPATIDTNASAGFGAGYNVGRGVIWNNKIVFPGLVFGGASVPTVVFEGTPVAAPAWSSRAVGVPVIAPQFTAAIDSLLDASGNLVVGWNQTRSGNVIDNIWITTDAGSGFASQVLFYDGIANPLDVPGITIGGGTHSLYLSQDSSARWFALTAIDMDAFDTDFPCGGVFLRTVVNLTSAVNPGPGGRKPVVLTPNQFDHCLHREYRLFCNIDYDLKGCARLPKCFTVDEREWGGG